MCIRCFLLFLLSFLVSFFVYAFHFFFLFSSVPIFFLNHFCYSFFYLISSFSITFSVFTVCLQFVTFFRRFSTTVFTLICWERLSNKHVVMPGMSNRLMKKQHFSLQLSSCSQMINLDVLHSSLLLLIPHFPKGDVARQ